MSFGYDEEHSACVYLKNQLQNEIEAKIKNDCTAFITGMAMGADIWYAEMVLACRRKYPGLPISLTAVVPYKNQPSSFPVSYMRRYADIVSKADRVIYITENYVPGCMHIRNKFMVGHADCMVAVSSGAEGGTQKTLHYAQKKGLDIVLFNPDTGSRTHIPAQLRFDLKKEQ